MICKVRQLQVGALIVILFTNGFVALRARADENSFSSLSVGTESGESIKPALAQGSNTSRNPLLPKKPLEFGTFFDYSARSIVQNASAGYNAVGFKSATLQSQLFGFRYAFDQTFALRVTGAYVNNQYLLPSKLAAAGVPSFHDQGLGDTKVELVVTGFKDRGNWLEASGGFTVPTGSIDQQMSPGRLAPQQLQLGSGTYDFTGRVVYAFDTHKFLFLNAFRGTHRIGENAHHYRAGDDWNFKTDVSYAFWKYVVPLVGVELKRREFLHSYDTGDIVTTSDAAPGSSAAKTSRVPGTIFQGNAGVRSFLPLGKQNTFKVLFEAGLPIFETAVVGQNQTHTLWYGNATATASF